MTADYKIKKYNINFTKELTFRLILDFFPHTPILYIWPVGKAQAYLTISMHTIYLQYLKELSTLILVISFYIITRNCMI